MIRTIRRERTLAQDIEELIMICGEDILTSAGMEYEKTQKHHGDISCFEHSVSVAYISLWLASRHKADVDAMSLIRGALLHDYYLYDWKDGHINGQVHLMTHPQTAHNKASHDFRLNDVEREIIERHMYPLTPWKPDYTEAKLVSKADKISATLEFCCPSKVKSFSGMEIGRKLL